VINGNKLQLQITITTALLPYIN